MANDTDIFWYPNSQVRERYPNGESDTIVIRTNREYEFSGDLPWTDAVAMNHFNLMTLCIPNWLCYWGYRPVCHVAIHCRDAELVVCTCHFLGWVWNRGDWNHHHPGSAVCGSQTVVGRGGWRDLLLSDDWVSYCSLHSEIGSKQRLRPEKRFEVGFLIGAVAMTIALLMTITIPEISMETEIAEKNETSIPAVPIEE